MHALISIHDVAPHTLDNVEAIIRLMPPACRRHLVLLVIPGYPWSTCQIARLRMWQSGGHTLAGHGWRHKAEKINGLYHRIHARVLSRRAAEHLALSRAELRDLLQRNYQWFIEHDLRAPDLYVPPAWAMGALTRQDLAASPFRFFEVTSGLYDTRTGQSRRLPLAGFEADTPWRRSSLRVWNAINVSRASAQRPVRLGLHPHDLELLLSRSVHQYLQRVTQGHDYRSLFNPG